VSKSWPTVKLSEVLRPVSRTEAVDATKDYRLLGIRLDGKGPFLRETVGGGETAATRLIRVASGDFIYSRLFAWRGAFGVIEADLDGCYVSGEFPTFLPDRQRLALHFLRYWFRLPATLASVDENCTGSTPLTRNRFKEEFFLALGIPLPSLAEQRRIVARIEELAAQINEAKALRKEAEAAEQHMLDAAFSSVTNNAQCEPLGVVAPIVRRAVAIDASVDYPELGIRSFGRGTFHKPPINGAALGSKRLFRIDPGDLVFNNVFAWEGAVAVARPEDAGRFGSHRFITCVPKPGVCTSHFLRFFFLTKEGISLLGEASPGGAGRNRTLGLEALSRIRVPTPDYRRQTWFDELQSEVDALKRLQAETAAELDALLPSILDKAFKGEL
jgi:type I restriction enzyme S subunit